LPKNWKEKNDIDFDNNIKNIRRHILKKLDMLIKGSQVVQILHLTIFGFSISRQNQKMNLSINNLPDYDYFKNH
jgi:hypothetical protein